MTVSFVLRLADGPLRDGRVVGRIEVVDTGESAVVRDADDLLSFLAHQGACADGGPPPDTGKPGP